VAFETGSRHVVFWEAVTVEVVVTVEVIVLVAVASNDE
jgi:hypothetical protein